MRKFIFIAWLFFTQTAYSQYYDKMYFVSWSINQPLSNTDFVGNTSARGGRLGYRELINEKFAAGVDLNWATYDDYIDRQTYTSSTGAITTDFFKYVESYGATVVVDYYFLTEGKIMPYVGLGLGGAYNNFKLYYNIFSSGNGAWGLLARPQAGAWIKLGEHSSWAFHTSVQFDFATTRNTDLGYNNFSNVGFQIGLVRLDW
jgi:opacity protein-like surface antigen